jgi:hydrogenase maturation factor
MRRTAAWGVESIWIGAGNRPETGLADHVLFWEEAPDVAPFDGRFLLLYHVLWELTSVCFDHPGLLREPESTSQCTDDVCITCSDEGRVAEVVAAAASTADVRAAGRVETIDTTLVGRLAPGDLVLVHAGSAITRMDGSSAA